MHVEPHPLLELAAFTTTFPRPLGAMPTPPATFALLSLNATAPLKSDDAVREAVRVLLRHGGFKPSGRSKPAQYGTFWWDRGWLFLARGGSAKGSGAFLKDYLATFGRSNP